MKIGEGVSVKKLANFPEINLDITVQIFEPGAASFRVWEDVSEPLNSKTYFRSHVALDRDFLLTTKYVDGPDEPHVVEPCKSWPHKEFRAGLRQALGHPREIEKGGENFCVIPIDPMKYSLQLEEADLAANESRTIKKGQLLLAYGVNHSVNGQRRGTHDSPWSITACIHSQAEILASESCRIIIYEAIPIDYSNYPFLADMGKSTN